MLKDLEDRAVKLALGRSIGSGCSEPGSDVSAQIDHACETPIGPGRPSRAKVRTDYRTGVRPGQSPRNRRPSRPRQKTDGLDAWEHWSFFKEVNPSELRKDVMDIGQQLEIIDGIHLEYSIVILSLRSDDHSWLLVEDMRYTNSIATLLFLVIAATHRSQYIEGQPPSNPKYFTPPKPASSLTPSCWRTRCSRRNAPTTLVLALGDGVIGDMIWCVAATFMHGVRFIQVPTTLLAMVHFPIGGKAAIDSPHGSNLIPAFWQPERIFIDMKFLETLPEREFVNGMPEVVKTAAIWDEAEFARLEQNAELILETVKAKSSDSGRTEIGNVENVYKDVILSSIRVKAYVVPADEREEGLRNLFNFGDSIGHTIKAIVFPQILHGEGVPIGIIKEAELTHHLGVCYPSATSYRHLSKISMSRNLLVESSEVERFLSIMGVDKKNDGRKKKVVLLAAIGRTHEKKASVINDDSIWVILSTSVIVDSQRSAVPELEDTPPGSKCISNRALVLAGLGSGTCRVKNLLHSDDIEHMLTAVHKLRGIQYSWEEDGDILVVNGNGGNLHACGDELYLGNAGTTARFLTSVATLVSPSGEHDSIVLTVNALTKSTTEEYSNHIPQGSCKNTAEYVVEIDSSSATYPLAIVAMTVSTVTGLNIGKKSFQGVARFAVDVLQPMGCTVEQSDYSTTIRGPPRGQLKPFPHVDMEPMTDAFLTASVLTPIANGLERSSLTGIANHRFKECNRITVMVHKLGKFGVTTSELEDRIWFKGIDDNSLKPPEGGVHCCDDH
ncbi:Dehydroquinate synthase-like protein [Choiromyces venosus 120613-1]|uniref:3-phosphoshikimate 1-carboxyvinyltransferase n=1 Tax=Choiromyces venosus 120613-1 TaxID=1336337 RepID=A0A3N4J6I5_9PEZI|nr:Dehydroquinate synthase-like protein [Choiromyces venosus 120613-1]